MSVWAAMLALLFDVFGTHASAQQAQHLPPNLCERSFDFIFLISGKAFSHPFLQKWYTFWLDPSEDSHAEPISPPLSRSYMYLNHICRTRPPSKIRILPEAKNY